jgi:hypothetical protein
MHSGMSYPTPDGTDATQEAALEELASLEVDLSLEVARLSNVHAPTSRQPQSPQYMQRPTWWWRFTLMRWAHSRARVNRHGSDVLAGFRLVLREWDDLALLDFLRRLPKPPLSSHGRRAS